MISFKTLASVVPQKAVVAEKNLKNNIPEISYPKIEQSIYSPKKSSIEPNKIIGNYYFVSPIDEVAPFARKLVYSPVINKQISVIENTENYINNIKHDKTRKILSAVFQRIINEGNNIEKHSENIINISQKLELLESSVIKKDCFIELDTLANDSPEVFKEYLPSVMHYVETIADAANIMQGKYMNINSKPRDLYKQLKKTNIALADSIDGICRSEEKFNKAARGKTTKSSYSDYLNKLYSNQNKLYPETNRLNLELESFRKIINEYDDISRSVMDELYDIYLEKINPDIRNIFYKIKKKYDTMVISSNPDITVKDALYVKEELSLWEKAGETETILPKVLDVNKLDNELILGGSIGSSLPYYRSIKVLDLLKFDAAPQNTSTLRHEINHLNDLFEEENLTPFENFKRTVSWIIIKLLHSKDWQNELLSGGILGKNNRKYALVDSGELKSVTAECDTEKLSKNFKNTLCEKFEMPRWIFHIPQNSIRLSEQNSRF